MAIVKDDSVVFVKDGGVCKLGMPALVDTHTPDFDSTELEFKHVPETAAAHGN